MQTAVNIQEERAPRHGSGMAMLVMNFILMAAAAALFIIGISRNEAGGSSGLWLIAIIGGIAYFSVIGPILFVGLKILKPNEALVLSLFGRYHGTLKGEGFFFVNPFAAAVIPGGKEAATASTEAGIKTAAGTSKTAVNKKISLKAMTLNNDKQKINDALGNPIIIGIVVIWKVVNTAKALFNVDNYIDYLSIQCDSALRNIVRLYPYDSPDEEGEKSLRGSSQEVALKLKEEIQEKVAIAGIEVNEARITHLSYAPEIAAAMLQRQQASAIIAARQMIVEGAVGMVQMALEQLNKNNIVDLDEERKAAMVSNLLVVLCGNKDPQPVVNSGSIY